MKKIKSIVPIIISIIIVVAAINSLLPKGIDDSPFDVNIVNDVQFTGEVVDITNNKYEFLLF